MKSITVKTWTGKDSLTLEGSALHLVWAGKQTVIPLSQVISFEIKEPKGKFHPGMITVRLGGSSDSVVRLTSILSVGGSNNIEFPHAYEYAVAAHQMQQAIADYSAGGSTQQSSEQHSDLDDLRKLKGLLDDGIITREEFNAKKRQILGL